jgi:superfamily II DNA or RNA helicase
MFLGLAPKAIGQIGAGKRVLSEVKARFLTGLTATPRRRDGLHPIAEMQLGPVRFAIDARSDASRRPTHRRSAP